MPPPLPNVSSFANFSSPGGLFHIELDSRQSGCGRLEAVGSTCLDTPQGGVTRTYSDLQQCLSEIADGNLTGAAAEIVRILKTSSDFEHELSAHIRRLRTGHVHGASCTSTADASASSPVYGLLPAANHMEPETLAAALMAEGYLMQIRDGAQQTKDSRSCLRTLKHRFLVCVGYQGPSTGGSMEYLHEPLVVEPRFREQFMLAHATPAFDDVLMKLPISFVGPLSRLESLVDHMARETASTFKHLSRALPPWRTKQAMMSKWAPGQLQELGRLMALQSTAVADSALFGTAACNAAGMATHEIPMFTISADGFMQDRPCAVLPVMAPVSSTRVTNGFAFGKPGSVDGYISGAACNDPDRSQRACSDSHVLSIRPIHIGMDAALGVHAAAAHLGLEPRPSAPLRFTPELLDELNAQPCSGMPSFVELPLLGAGPSSVSSIHEHCQASQGTGTGQTSANSTVHGPEYRHRTLSGMIPEAAAVAQAHMEGRRADRFDALLPDPPVSGTLSVDDGGILLLMSHSERALAPSGSSVSCCTTKATSLLLGTGHAGLQRWHEQQQAADRAPLSALPCNPCCDQQMQRAVSQFAAGGAAGQAQPRVWQQTGPHPQQQAEAWAYLPMQMCTRMGTERAPTGPQDDCNETCQDAAPLHPLLQMIKDCAVQQQQAAAVVEQAQAAPRPAVTPFAAAATVQEAPSFAAPTLAGYAQSPRTPLPNMEPAALAAGVMLVPAAATATSPNRGAIAAAAGGMTACEALASTVAARGMRLSETPASLLLSITRRSSSDLSRAVTKIKAGKGLLAAAFGRGGCLVAATGGAAAVEGSSRAIRSETAPCTVTTAHSNMTTSCTGRGVGGGGGVTGRGPTTGCITHTVAQEWGGAYTTVKWGSSFNAGGAANAATAGMA